MICVKKYQYFLNLKSEMISWSLLLCFVINVDYKHRGLTIVCNVDTKFICDNLYVWAKTNTLPFDGDHSQISYM